MQFSLIWCTLTLTANLKGVFKIDWKMKEVRPANPPPTPPTHPPTDRGQTCWSNQTTFTRILWVLSFHKNQRRESSKWDDSERWSWFSLLLFPFSSGCVIIQTSHPGFLKCSPRPFQDWDPGSDPSCTSLWGGCVGARPAGISPALGTTAWC